MSQTAKRLAELGIMLPKPAAPVANYRSVGREGRRAPSTVGMAHLPMKALAEVEALFEISI